MCAASATLSLNSKCPCGSGKAIVRCHWDIDGRLRKKVPSLRPPGPPTAHANSKCYLRDTCDCSEQISREHYMSAAVIAQLGKKIRITGLPWLQADKSLETTIPNLTAKILCKRHNEALSPLDAEAAHFFSTLTAILADLDKTTASAKPRFHLVSGDALELWMLKVACGLYFSVGSKGRKHTSETHSIDMSKVNRAFFDLVWEHRAGLYFSGAIGAKIDLKYEVGMSPLTDDRVGKFCGTAIKFNNFELDCIFDTARWVPASPSALHYRPSELIFERRARKHHLLLTWRPGTPPLTINIVSPN